jgi:hypothetical protein
MELHYFIAAVALVSVALVVKLYFRLEIIGMRPADYPPGIFMSL